MPPSKRKSVRRKAIDAARKDQQDDLPDSSPSARPSAKKRKLNGAKSSKKELSPSPELPQTSGEQDQPSDAESEDASDTSLLETIVASLSVSKDPVFVARDHANELETESVNAFAKIAGKDWTYYVREQTINIGRPPDDKQIANSLTPGASSPIQDLKEQFPVHIDLGPSKIVSRHHAAIYYDDEHWFVRVNGRNGVRIDNTLLKRNQKAQLHSGSVLEVAGTQMMFVLPNLQPQIHQDFINRARLLLTGEDPASISDRDTEPELSTKFEDAQADASGFPSIAPAPPNFRRTITPQPSDSPFQRNALENRPAPSPVYGRGMMMESTQEIDYARDSAKDLKPPYSYAHLIAQAIFSSEEEKLTLSQIYNFIADKYAFYRHANSGWQNSIRHNLSLNKAFQKVPRRTDEPGKGMKWQIAPENRQEYLKKISKRGPTASSNPSSPASIKDVNPNFRGPNGQNLGYDTSMVSSFSAREPAGQRAAGAHMSFPPYPPMHGAYPAPLAGPPHMSQPTPQLHPATSTPQRSRANTGTTLPDNGAPGPEDSPLPSHFPGTVPRRTPYYTLPTSTAHHSPANPTLSSSYLDTPFQPSHTRDHHNHHLITPAPLRQNPRLAPPSTLVAPSKFMPESSPAQSGGLFWKGFLAGGMTPGAPGSAIPPDLSPVKNLASSPIRTRNGAGPLTSERDVMSSSPPPMDALAGGSPSKPAKERNTPLGTSSFKREIDPKRSGDDADSPNDFHKSAGLATSNGNLRLSVGPGAAGLPIAGALSVKDERTNANAKQEEDDDDEQGFDLARGFAPISSFSSSQRVDR